MYVEALSDAELVEPETPERMSESSIGALEACNKVRHEGSLAPDIRALNYDESVLVQVTANRRT